MRFDGDSNGLTASKAIEELSELELKQLLQTYGEVSLAESVKISSAIARHKKQEKIQSASQLREIIFNAIFPAKNKWKTVTQVFQALRIYVNNELFSLKQLMDNSLSLLKLDGLLVVITFHSLEEATVKQWHLKEGKPFLKSIDSGKKPTKEEVQMNPRSKSAKLYSFRFKSL